MIEYKGITFAKGIDLSFADFKKTFGSHLKRFSETEVKECYKKVTKNVKLSNTSGKSKKADKEESK